ncbi:MAG: hypothetical protein ACREHC_07610 [Candidatus Levyibacteriota bacterium]
MASIEGPGTAFHILSRPPADVLRRQIADQCELPLSRVNLRELALIDALDDKTHPLARKYIGDEGGRKGLENFQELRQRTEVLLDLPARYFSYGVFSPSYLEALNRQKESLPSEMSTPHRALLLGALTVDTIREFSTTVRTVHPNASCDVIDIEGHKTSQVSSDLATFTLGSALNTPFPDESFESVHGSF